MAISENIGSISYLTLLKTLETELMKMVYVNSVTTGDITDVDLNKRTIFPLVHIIVNSVSMGGDSGTLEYNVTIMAMDIVNEYKSDDAINDPLLMGNDNEHFVLNNTLTILNKLNEFLYRGTLHNENIQINNAGNCEPFFDRFENRLAGWSYTANIFVNNNLDICSDY